jgi:hypothetical protein
LASTATLAWAPGIDPDDALAGGRRVRVRERAERLAGREIEDGVEADMVAGVESMLAGRSLSGGIVASAAGEELHRETPGGRVS